MKITKETVELDYFLRELVNRAKCQDFPENAASLVRLIAQKWNEEKEREWERETR